MGGPVSFADLTVALIRPLGPPAHRENKNPSIFATFLRLRIPFCLRKAELGRFVVDLLRFRAEIRALAPCGNP